MEKACFLHLVPGPSPSPATRPHGCLPCGGWRIPSAVSRKKDRPRPAIPRSMSCTACTITPVYPAPTRTRSAGICPCNGRASPGTGSSPTGCRARTSAVPGTKTCRPGDQLCVTSIDHLGRNYEEIQRQWRLPTQELHVDILFAEMHELWKTGKLSSVKAANGAAWHGQYSATALNPQKSLKIEHGKKVYFFATVHFPVH